MKAALVQPGLVEYEDALRMQQQLVEARHEGRIGDIVLELEHPHLYTVGRRSAEENILADRRTLEALDIRIYRSNRGGNITYHGPGQAVVYPILALPPYRQRVSNYIGSLEEAMIRTAADYGVEAGRKASLPGVWVGDRKLGAVGAHLSRWVTSHGLAFNVNTDLRYYRHIVPCGLRGLGVTSLEALLEQNLDMYEVRVRLLCHLGRALELSLHKRDIDMHVIQAIVFRRVPVLEVLVLHRADTRETFWQLIIGKIGPGEVPEEAAAREVQEETGLVGTLYDMSYVHAFMLDPEAIQFPKWPFPCFVQEHTFAVEVSPDARVHIDPGTHNAYRWLTPQLALEMQRWPTNREGIRRVRARFDQTRGEDVGI